MSLRARTGKRCAVTVVQCSVDIWLHSPDPPPGGGSSANCRNTENLSFAVCKTAPQCHVSPWGVTGPRTEEHAAQLTPCRKHSIQATLQKRAMTIMVPGVTGKGKGHAGGEEAPWEGRSPGPAGLNVETDKPSLTSLKGDTPDKRRWSEWEVNSNCP